MFQSTLKNKHSETLLDANVFVIVLFHAILKYGCNPGAKTGCANNYTFSKFKTFNLKIISVFE